MTKMPSGAQEPNGIFVYGENLKDDQLRSSPLVAMTFLYQSNDFFL